MSTLDGRPLDKLTEQDLLALISAGTAEGKSIEYKQALPGNSDEEKREFLADVTSFANASGGHIVFGMKEDQGLAKEMCGLGPVDPDAEILRLENIARGSVDPRIPGLGSHGVPLGIGGHAIVMRIPASWQAPHRIVFRNSGRFWGRSSKGKHELDVRELRAAFLLNEATGDRIRSFRADRINKVMAGETPVPVDAGAKYVLHIIPLGALTSGAGLDIRWLDGNRHRLPRPGMGSDSRVNFDGLVAYQITYPPRPGSVSTPCYIQAFRSGILEWVNAGWLAPRPGEDSAQLIYPTFEESVLEEMTRLLQVLRDGGVVPPLVCCLTLVGVKGYGLWLDPSRRWPPWAGQKVDREILLIPDVLIEGYEADLSRVMKSAFDAVWNAVGFASSWNYDENGERRSDRR